MYTTNVKILVYNTNKKYAPRQQCKFIKNIQINFLRCRRRRLSSPQQSENERRAGVEHLLRLLLFYVRTAYSVVHFSAFLYVR